MPWKFAQRLIHPHALTVVMLHELVEQGLLHHRRGHLVGIEAELHALRVIVPAVVREDAVADTR